MRKDLFSFKTDKYHFNEEYVIFIYRLIKNMKLN